MTQDKTAPAKVALEELAKEVVSQLLAVIAGQDPGAC